MDILVYLILFSMLGALIYFVYKNTKNKKESEAQYDANR